MDFDEMYEKAISILNPRKIARGTYAGQVAAVILTDRGNFYCGVNIDAPCSVGFCAEHGAIGAMVMAGETRIVKMVAVDSEKKVIPPCGRCREFISQINDENRACQVLLANGRIAAIGELLPDPWN